MPSLGSVIARAVVKGSGDILDFDEDQKSISGGVNATFLTGDKPISSVQQGYMAQVLKIVRRKTQNQIPPSQTPKE